MCAKQRSENPRLAAVHNMAESLESITDTSFPSLHQHARPPHRHLKAANIGTPALPSRLNPSTGLSHRPFSFLRCSRPCHMIRHPARHLHRSYILAAEPQISLISFVGMLPPSTILNVDFSHRAIELGIQREREEFADARIGDGKGSMLLGDG